MKKYTILLATLFTLTVAKADDYALKVTLHEGTTATYVLSTKPVISYSEENVTIKTQSLEDSYPINDVKSFSFVDNESAGLEDMSQNVTYDFRNNVFTCEGHDIQVFNLSGQSVAAGNSSVSLETLGCGTYIVNAGNRSIKVLKK